MWRGIFVRHLEWDRAMSSVVLGLRYWRHDRRKYVDVSGRQNGTVRGRLSTELSVGHGTGPGTGYGTGPGTGHGGYGGVCTRHQKARLARPPSVACGQPRQLADNEPGLCVLLSRPSRFVPPRPVWSLFVLLAGLVLARSVFFGGRPVLGKTWSSVWVVAIVSAVAAAAAAAIVVVSVVVSSLFCATP